MHCLLVQCQSSSPLHIELTSEAHGSPKQHLGGYLEAAPMITVLDAGIQAALNLALIQTSGLEPIPQGISVWAYAQQCEDRGEKKGVAIAFSHTYPSLCGSCQGFVAG